MSPHPPARSKKQTLNGKTLLVTGGAGFIGSNFIRQTLKKYPKAQVVCLDALTYAGNKDNLKGLPKSQLVFVRGTITDGTLISKLYTKYCPDFIINFAAESHVDRSIHGGAATFIHTNIVGTTTLLERARDLPALQKFVQVSTDEVYGALSLRSNKKFTEQSPLAPNSPYASSKAAADLIVRSFFVTYDLPAVVTRCSNNYGPYQYPEKFIPYSITRLMEGKPIAVYGDGLYVRDWIHVDDHVSALLLVLMGGIPGEIYNIGADDEVSNLALAQNLLAHMGHDQSAISHVADRPGHDRRYAIDASKIKKQLGWKPKYSLRRAFKSTIVWYVQNLGWVQRALAGAGVANTHIVSAKSGRNVV